MLVLEKSGGVILHPMKTGGTWVREALTRAGVSWREQGPQHGGIYEAQEHGLVLDNHPEKVWTILREPFGWYKSLFSFRDKAGWGGDLSLGHTCRSKRFDLFVLMATQKHPRFLTEYYARFTARDVGVLYNKRLVEDLVAVLRKLGEQFDEQALRATQPANAAGRTAAYEHVGWTPTVASLVVASEWQLFVDHEWSTEP